MGPLSREERLKHQVWIWLGFFAYTAGIAFFIQLYLLKYLFPAWSDGNGLLTISLDSIRFHNLAADLADKIRHGGWQAWKLRPEGQAPSGIAAILYVLIAPKPWTMIPLNAALHAMAALALARIINLFLKNWVKSVICALPFLIFPSALQWTAQLHKDTFSILGTILFLEGIILLLREKKPDAGSWFPDYAWPLVLSSCGILSIWLVRPFIVKIMLPFFALFFCFFVLSLLIQSLQNRALWKRTAGILIFTFIILLILTRIRSNLRLPALEEYPATAPGVRVAEVLPKGKASVVFPSDKPDMAKGNKGYLSHVYKRVSPPSTNSPIPHELPFKLGKVTDLTPKVSYIELPRPRTKLRITLEESWTRTEWLSPSVDNQLHLLANMRRGFRYTAPEAKSNIDHDVGFTSSEAILVYLPRAFSIALFAPFPDQWFTVGSSQASTIMRKVSAFEMMVVYFSYIFLFYALVHWRKRLETWLIFIFSLYMMVIYGLVVCNIGSLYRMRYVYIMMLVALGLAGFFALTERINKNKCAG